MPRKKYCEPCMEEKTPAADGDCPTCGAGLVTYPAENPREKGDDDGIEYGHPRDRKEGRE